MQRNRLIKLKIALLTLVLVPVLSFAAFAADDAGYMDPGYFALDEEIKQDLSEEISREYSNVDVVQFNYVYSDKETVEVPSLVADGAYGVKTYLNAKEEAESGKNMYISFCSYFMEKQQDSIPVVIKYSAEESGSELCFQKEDGTIISASDLSNATLSELSDDKKSVQISFTPELLQEIGFYNDANDKIDALKIPESICGIDVESISVVLGKNGNVAVNNFIDGDDYTFNLAKFSYIAQAGQKTATAYSFDDGKVVVDTCEGIELITERCRDKYSLDISNTISAERVEELVAATGFYASLPEEEEDIPERDYLAVDDESVSTVYADSYIFASNMVPYAYQNYAENMGTDIYGEVYACDGILNSDVTEMINPLDLLGCSIEDVESPYNSMRITVANVKDSEYAGILSFKQNNDGIIEEESGDGAEESIAADAESETTTSEAATSGAAIDATYSEIDENDIEINESTESESDYDSVPTEDDYSDESYLAFAKGDCNSYGVDSDEMILTEAFLKKSSYCAIDENGIICAVFNEHGRLLETAEGYTEDDIYEFVLIPYMPGAEDDPIAEVSIKYNDYLAMEQAYLSMTYFGEDGCYVDSIGSFSGFVDCDTDTEISMLTDYAARTFVFSTDSDNVEMMIFDADEWQIIRQDRPAEVDPKELDYIDDDSSSEYDDEYMGEEIAEEITEETPEGITDGGTDVIDDTDLNDAENADGTGHTDGENQSGSSENFGVNIDAPAQSIDATDSIGIPSGNDSVDASKTNGADGKSAQRVTEVNDTGGSSCGQSPGEAQSASHGESPGGSLSESPGGSLSESPGESPGISGAVPAAESNSPCSIVGA
uniref:Uncharacterized protein n=1 Tax=uncultured bacterium fosmid pJB39A3 TaxID=1478063 RepID=A0A0H3U7I5_9BACT|nr:hypothetical protein [uncultured bacterium fosmid pJB39A3]